VTGRGENVTESSYPQDYWLLLVTPRLSVSTGAAYAGLRMELTNPKNPFILPQCGAVTELIDALKLSTNDFEEVHLLSYPELNKIKDGLLHIGALLARMSGSGPTFFGLFDSQPNIETTLFSEGGDWHVSTVRPITLPIADTSYAGGNRGDHRGTGYTSR
jgi:4-diphosphocytidyl-2C-methyl-D-erythritol kinase